MKESTWTCAFLHDLRKALPEAEVIKFNSYGAAVEGGIPDFSVTRFDVGPYSKTVWCEVKVLPSQNKMFKPLQLERLKRLGGWYLVWHLTNRRGWLFRADESENWSEGATYTRQELIDRIARFF